MSLSIPFSSALVMLPNSAWCDDRFYNNVDFLDRIVQLLDLEIVSPQCELRGNSGIQEFQGGLG